MFTCLLRGVAGCQCSQNVLQWNAFSFRQRFVCTMALVDSQAAFSLHCDKIDGTGWLKRIMSRNSLRTFSDLGFAVGTPQTPATQADFDLFCGNINGHTEMTISEAARVRRLHFEACTLIIAHTKQQVSLDASAEGSRKLPVAEKQARLLQQQERLTGVSLTGELQPSFALIDLAASMLETNAVIWISPSRCSKRESEIQMSVTKEKSTVVAVEQQTLKITTPDDVVKVDHSTELQLQWALQRRGVALDQCRLVDWDVHQKWLHYLLGLMTKPVPDGYSKIRMDQLLKADKELFLVMAQEIQQSGERLSDTPSPMNVSMQKLMTDPRITMHLLPVPNSLARASASTTATPPPKSDVAPKGRGKVRKDGKQSARAKSMCPAELKEYKQVDDKGRPICWAFNLKGGCKETVTDGRCKKGSHICIKCKRTNHGLSTCRVNS